MPKTKTEIFTQAHEKIKARAIYKIYKSQKVRFIDLLNSFDKKSWEKKNVQTQFDDFLEEINPEVPEYLMKVLPNIMNQGAKEPIKKYKDELPEGYKFNFEVETDPASQYLQDLEDLMLSERDGSISKTTRDELRGIMDKGIADGKSYSEIGKEIESVDPWVFSRARANLIAVNEIGRAYGWANFQPAVVLQDEGYIMEKEWTTSHDEKVRKTHKQNQEAGLIPLDEPFPGTGDMFAPSTNEINCRCTGTHQIVGIKKKKDFYILPKFITEQRLAKYKNVRVWHTKKVFDKQK